MVHTTMPAHHRPVRLVRAIKVQRDLAYKIERFTQYLLRHRQAKGISTGTSVEVQDWFAVPPHVASRYLNIALEAVQTKARELGRTDFYWRKVLT